MSAKYVQRVRRYYRDYRPVATVELGTDSEAEDFFRSLARQIEDQVQDAEIPIAGPDVAGETYLEKVGRLNMARLQAEELVLADLLYSSPPEEEDENEGIDPDRLERFQLRQEQQATAVALLEEMDYQSQKQNQPPR